MIEGETIHSNSAEQTRLTEDERAFAYRALAVSSEVTKAAIAQACRPEIVEEGRFVSLNALLVANSILFTTNLETEGLILFLEELLSQLRASEALSSLAVGQPQ